MTANRRRQGAPPTVQVGREMDQSVSVRDRGSVSVARRAGNCRCKCWRLVASIAISLSLLVGPHSFARAGESARPIAGDGVNEFDLAGYCYGAQYRDGADSGGGEQKIPVPDSRFGYDGGSADQGAAGQQFAYITARYSVHIGQYGDPADCEFKRYLYRLDGNGSFRQQALDESAFAQTENRLRAYARTYAKSHAGKMVGQPDGSSVDSVGGCLFPIVWQTIAGAIVNYVVPHYERTLSGEPSNCYAWGERHLTNSSITSSEFDSLSIGPDLLFVADKTFQVGFLFKGGSDIQCIKGADAFSHHILITRQVFDAQMRPDLEGALRGNNQKVGSPGSGDGRKALSFPDSVRLKQEFATVVAGLAEKKGCY